MRPDLLLLFFVVGAGNYLMRAIPLFLALRRKAASNEEATSEQNRLSRLLPFVGPSVVAALLVTSVLPPPGEPGYATELVKTGLALVPTLAVALKYGNLGLTVVVGASSYGTISALV